MNVIFFEQAEINFAIDLALCLFSGIIIGAERESRMKDAGISTHVLVITGAMVFTFLSSVVDPASKSRIAAQVVTGIGFLGAGLILKDGGNVRNLTTAASLWVAASIGMAYGFNYHVVGLMVTLVVALTPRIPHLKRRSRTRSNDDG
ncbi:MAG: MgtC/SapB family protein [Candidatus Adiutrix sp.]|jgi:putative Mg2+ transporter-C (MgtC) family protein|nr:MgtC/SapB family protein [Candidatus Adiutrix sp.]